ncbi:response regulator [candidate division TA06 bacterium]|uniref:histidine kinase n=1 Tax=candidate division TA06 bacterium TaxID=2250710 RepID=A0A933I8E8_UNCT6|nr:response regulator [candidate division TA06 bacterium]
MPAEHQLDMQLLGQSFLRNIPQGLMACNPDDSRVIYVNPAWETVTGFAPTEMLEAKPPYPHWPPGDKEKMVQQMLQARHDGALACECRLQRKDGKMIPVQTYHGQVRDGDGRLTALYQLVSDNSDNKTLEAKLLQAQKMEAVGHLAGGLAHDMNNILQVILTSGDMMLTEAGAGHPWRQRIMDIIRAGEKAAVLTRQLLTFARKNKVEVKLLDLNPLVIEFQSMISRLLGERIKVEITLGRSLPLVMADHSQIEQVLMNLAVNARDAMDQGGLFSISTREEFLDENYAKTHPEAEPGHYALISVSDTGAGMDAEAQKRLFDPFFTTKAKEQGTGLGLSVVYGIVKQHKGHIYVYSEKDRGTTFKIYLPAAADQRKGRRANQQTQIRFGHGIILLVEDEKAVREMEVQLLTSLGYQVIPARNGEQALEVFAQRRGNIDLLMSDMIMPGLSGWELYMNLKKQKPELKALFASGYSDESSRPLIRSHGVDFLQKPFSLHKLSVKLHEVLKSTKHIA